MSSDKLDIKELQSSLKQLIIGFGHQLHGSSSAEEVQQAYLHMEELDENFHKYGLVKSIRNSIEDSIGNLVDKEVEQLSPSENKPSHEQETVVSKITEKILCSQEYLNLAERLRRSLSIASENLIKNFDEEFPQTQNIGIQPDQRKRSEILFSVSDGDSSFDDSSSNHSTVMFLNSETQQTIASNLNRKSSLEARTSALHNLLQAACVLDTSSTLWQSIRNGLRDVLVELDDELWFLGLKIIAKGFNSSSGSTSREMYLILVEDFLMNYFVAGEKSGMLRMKDVLDCRQPHINKLLKAFRLMNDFQQQVPLHYPEKNLEEIVETTISLLSLSSSAPPDTLTPVHFLALVDSKAEWFIKSMHGNYSRSVLLRLLEKKRSLVNFSVKCCLDFVAARISGSDNREQMKDVGRIVYSAEHMELLLFTHSLCILSRLILFEKGRKCFPEKIQTREVTVTHLLVELIRLVTMQHNSATIDPSAASSSFDPCVSVIDCIKRLCISEDVCSKCICNDDVINALLQPIRSWLDGKMDLIGSSEVTLVRVTDLLSAVASTNSGRRQLLYGREKSAEKAAIRVLAEFVQKAIKKELPSRAVMGGVIFVCRQLYTTCEGLLLLHEYKLNKSIFMAWRAANREADNVVTPTPASERSSNHASQLQSQHMRPFFNKLQGLLLEWEDALRDNLLNFASTPKGLLLLEQTGVLGECVSYMYSRYARKLQVSKCEKFGYGYMMSQVAATAPGIIALSQAGFISALVHSLWGSLEVTDDCPLFTPKAWPVNAIDKSTKKPFTNLVNLLSSFLSVYELLGQQVLPTKSEYTVRQEPDSIASLLDRLVFVNTDVKIRSLFNYEQSHVCGLRLLSALTCCLDTMILLQTQYDFQKMLLECQSENVLEDSSNILIDMLSLERNYILVKTFSVGGPSERILPPREMHMTESSLFLNFLLIQIDVEIPRTLGGISKGNPTQFQFPLFSTYPIPSEYIPKLPNRPSTKEDKDFSRLIADARKPELLGKCESLLHEIFVDRADMIQGSALMNLLESVIDGKSQMQQEIFFSTSDYSLTDTAIKNFQLSKIQMEGVLLTVRYGCHLKLLSSSRESTDKLQFLIKKCSIYLKHQQMETIASKIRCLNGEESIGYDWFVSTIFLLSGGNADRSWKFLYKFSSFITSAYVWMQRIHKSVHLPQALVLGSIPPVFSVLCHSVELILQMDLPHVYSTFKMSGFAPAQICQQWIRQCFWNYLDWTQICHYICLCVVLGADYQVYMCVAILRHLHRNLMQQMQDKNLICFLKEEPIRGFQVEKHLEFMKSLEKKFRLLILNDMQTIFKQ